MGLQSLRRAREHRLREIVNARLNRIQQQDETRSHFELASVVSRRVHQNIPVRDSVS